jgi:hypothetical protein
MGTISQSIIEASQVKPDVRAYDFLCECGDGRWTHAGKYGYGKCLRKGCPCTAYIEKKAEKK